MRPRVLGNCYASNTIALLRTARKFCDRRAGRRVSRFEIEESVGSSGSALLTLARDIGGQLCAIDDENRILKMLETRYVMAE